MMTRPWFAAALLTPMLLLAGNATARVDSGIRKCATRVSNEVRYLVDGKEVDSLAFKALKTDDVKRVQVQCINPVDLTVIAPGSKIAGVGAVSAWTTTGPLKQLEELLARVNDAQRAHHRVVGTFALTTEALQLGEMPSEVHLSLETTGDGWRASALLTLPTSPRCTVFGGKHPSPPGASGVVHCM